MKAQEESHSSTLSLTPATDDGGWSTSSSGRLNQKKGTVPIVQQTVWVTENFCTGAGDSKRTGFEPRTIGRMASGYTD